MSWCGSLWVHPTWNLLRFLDVIFMSLIKFGKLSAIISSNNLCIFLSSASGIPSGLLETVPQILEALFTCLHSFSFLFFGLVHFNCPNFKFTSSLFCLLSFWTLVIVVLFNTSCFGWWGSYGSRISFWLLFFNNFFLLILSLYAHITFLPLTSCSSWSTLRTVVKSV